MQKTERQPAPNASRQDTDLIIGRNAVAEALRAGVPIDSVITASGERQGSIVPLLAQCREKGIPVKQADVRKLDFMCGGARHQGILAVVACKEYVGLDDLFTLAAQKGEPPFFIVCDGLEDPHNVGAVLRTAEAAGAHGVILPRRHSAGLTAAVYKASAGAAAHIPVARVTNLSDALRRLKEKGVWVYGLDMDGAPWCRTDLTGPVALVIGSEGSGIGRLVREHCDGVLSLPMCGRINSLNASVAGGIAMYEVVRQRQGLK